MPKALGQDRTKEFKCSIKESHSIWLKYNTQKPCHCKRPLQGDRSLCLVGSQCPSGLRHFLHLYHQQSRGKNRTGRVKTEGEEVSPHPEACCYPGVRMHICSGTGGSDACEEERRCIWENTRTGQNMLKDATDMGAEYIHKSCRKKSNSAGKDGLKVCVKGLHAFKLAPKFSFAHPKLPPQLSS